eukprot:PhM_4_TR18987/c0_g1_i1/m.74891/K01808/rpiB; ribose 5-phosphate isomerase B
MASKRDRMSDFVVAFGSDHGGVGLKAALLKHVNESPTLKAAGIRAIDRGVFSEETKADYPNVARDVCGVLLSGECSFAVLIDGGAGMAMGMAANKIGGIRAAVCADPFFARMTRQHNDANVLCIGSGALGTLAAKDTLQTFLETEFEGERHIPRLALLHGLEGTGNARGGYRAAVDDVDGKRRTSSTASPFRLPL